MNQHKKIIFKDCFIGPDPPFWIVADFECRNVPVDHPKRKTMQTGSSRLQHS